MIVLQAVRERKKNEAEANRPLMKDKLSQTGWKLRENFLKRGNAHLEDKDRIDVFNGPVITEEDREEESDEDDCVILEYR